ncbi:UNVERIFIED_CONTAM: hypothetical protein K2H54_075555 [Gekko kuhli]
MTTEPAVQTGSCLYVGFLSFKKKKSFVREKPKLMQCRGKLLRSFEYCFRFIVAFGFCCLMEFEPKKKKTTQKTKKPQAFLFLKLDCTYAFCTSGTFYTGD